MARDLYTEAYRRGRAGHPLSEELKRLGETSPEVMEGWTDGMQEFGEAGPEERATARDERGRFTSQEDRRAAAVGRADAGTGPLARSASRAAVAAGHAGARAARTVRRRGPAQARRGAKALTGTVSNATGLLVGALLVVLLYVLLINGKAVASFFSGLVGFLTDLVNPAKPLFGGA